MKRRRGFVQLAILHLLKDDSMHGYQIMKELEERSDRHYSASAGSVYPALQELLDQGMIDLMSDSNKKVYHINGKGKERLDEFAKRGEGDFWTMWKERWVWRSSEEAIKLKSVVEHWEAEMHLAMKKARKSPENARELMTFLEEITERLKKDNL